MTSYAFILGRKNLISLAELEAKLPSDAKFLNIQSDFAVIEFPKPFANPQQELNLLGGTIKIAEVVAETGANLNQSEEKIAEILKNRFAENSRKVTYAVSVNSFPQKSEIILKKILIGLKKKLTASGVKSRFINKNFQNPEVAQLKGEKITTDGIELTILKTRNSHLIAKTVAIQDIDSYSRRDYERPERDPKLGMLPPKLAQIMINLCGLQKFGEATKDLTILDPFCGIGTVLSEALLMGYKEIGSDLETLSILKSEKNLNWLKQNFPSTSSGKFKVFQKDSTRLEATDLEQKISAVVSETWLGPNVKTCPRQEQIENNFSQLEKLVTGFLGRAREFLEPQTPLVLTILTYFKPPNQFIFPEELIKKINRLGFELEPLISDQLTDSFDLELPDQFRLIYSRPDQVVCRTILKLTLM